MRLILAILCLLAVLFAACGGGGEGKEGNSTTPQAAVTSSSQSTTSSDTTPSGGATSTPIPDPFAGLQSYHYMMEMSGDGANSVIIKGSVKAPDSIAVDFYLAGSDTPVNSMIIIGTQAWSKNSTSGQWQQVDIAEAEGGLGPILPGQFWGSLLTDQLVSLGKDLGGENVNGVPARHLQISEVDADTLRKLTDTVVGTGGPQPDSASMELWLAEDGRWPAKADITLNFPSGSEISTAEIAWEVSDVNSSAISIQPPL